MKTFYLLISLLLSIVSFGQTMSSRLEAAIKSIENDAQFKHAILSLYVVDSKTGKIIFDKNAQTGLAPASCQKVITSASAFEMLGKEYKYKTELRYFGLLKDTSLMGNFYIVGYGDPTLGSWRYPGTGEQVLMQHWINVLKQKNIRSIGNLIVDTRRFSAQFIPGGWAWEDIGNYYGAGAGALNWRENQFDLILKAGDEVGKNVEITGIKPGNYAMPFTTELTTGKKGSGDNAYIYLPSDGEYALVKGTIPMGEKNFKISGAIINPSLFLWKEFKRNLDAAGIRYKKVEEKNLVKEDELAGYPTPRIDTSHTYILDQYFSPSLDSINYWFLKKSINLYGEAFVKTIAYEKTKFGSTDTGIAIIKDFWSNTGIEPSAINIIDGSGLSPANRVTTNALVTVMQYARQQKWFVSFYNALPEMNGIKMKDGYITGVRSYTGYIKSKNGEEYTFSFIVNNFDGSAGTVREKMWKLLDILK
jgi:D-alanyl-D-alanine carboxypeptidase/D-alanyl-D-alanine-endopeptidase (penicillin-binding protein 4)